MSEITTSKLANTEIVTKPRVIMKLKNIFYLYILILLELIKMKVMLL